MMLPFFSLWSKTLAWCLSLGVGTCTDSCHRLRRFGGNEAAAESWISQLKFLYNPVYGGSVHQLCDRLFLCPSFQQKVLSKLGFSRFFLKNDAHTEFSFVILG